MLKRVLRSQKGAMFGLDTRIALAVMGTMSVIVGYYSLGRIQDAKEAVLLKELTSIEEAMLGYQADLGTFTMFTIEGGTDGIKDFEALWDVNQVLTGLRNRWNGPYYKYSTYTRDHTQYGEFSVVYSQDDSSMTTCTSATKCFAWIELSDVPLDVWRAVNRAVDESYGSDSEGSPGTAGKVRADSTSSSPVTLYFRALERPTN